MQLLQSPPDSSGTVRTAASKTPSAFPQQLPSAVFENRHVTAGQHREFPALFFSAGRDCHLLPAGMLFGRRQRRATRDLPRAPAEHNNREQGEGDRNIGKNSSLDQQESRSHKGMSKLQGMPPVLLCGMAMPIT